jgi:glycosyl transferase family 2
MKIQCYMPCYNEADILPHTLRHLREQGVSVHILDGWSTDGSFEIAQQASRWISPPEGWVDRRPIELTDHDCLRVSVERFPAAGPDPIQNCTAILKRIEDLAAESDADWCLYTDADEWRRSPNQIPTETLECETLSAAVERVDRTGWNAIDFRVFQFYCCGDAWDMAKRDHSPEEVFRNYDESDCISRIPNRKLWKNAGRVQLAGGGHEVTFPGMRVYPQKFSMKHYPFRTPEQARRKIQTRLARRRMEEHAKGWGVHYDQYPPGFDFCWDPAKLLYWKDTRSPLP